MAVTSLAEVTNQVQTFWAPIFTKELRETSLLPSLVSKDYQGEITKKGDTVRVSQINAPTGQLLTVGTNADSFDSEAISTSYVDIKADKRAVASFEVQDLVDIQSQLGNENSEMRNSLLHAVKTQINNHLYSLVSPSASAPDHILNGITDMSAAQVSALRTLAAQARWDRQKGWWILADPVYYSDMLDDANFSSSLFGGTDAPMVGGQIIQKRFGFNILEDNTAGLLTLGTTGADCALVFHPDFMHLALQKEVQFKISDLHAQKKFGYVISVDVIFGAVLGIDGDEKHIRVYNS